MTSWMDVHRFRSGLLRAILAFKEIRYSSDTQRRVQAECSSHRAEFEGSENDPGNGFPGDWGLSRCYLDLFSRRVVGWAISNRIKQDLALRALNMATALRRPPPGCVHHTDRGSQYCAHEYQKLLRKHGFKVSKSGKGDCYDNSAVESFFKSLKAELVWRRHWHTRRDVEVALFEYINGFYNPRRRHSALGWKSPVASELGAS